MLLVNRVVRAFAFGLSAVLIGIRLQSRSLSPAEVGLALGLATLAASLSGLLAAAAGSRFGRRVTLAAIGVLMLLAGADLAFATQHWLLILAGVTGMVGTSGTDNGPFLPIEQAMLPQAVPPERRNLAFARYSLSGAAAAAGGSLAAGLGTSSGRAEVIFVVFAALGAVTALIPLLLSQGIEGELRTSAFGSFRPLAGLSALFAVDSLGTGLVSNAVLAYWLHLRFGASPEVLGPTFATMSILAAASFELAGRLANRIGLIRTMVFTHLPSNLLLLLVPILPGLGWALAVLIARSSIVSMDQPARQAYVVSIVPPNERAGALALTGAVRGVASTAGPIITGLSLQLAAFAVPFVAAGLLKSGYDLTLYAGYRQRFGDHEASLAG